MHCLPREMQNEKDLKERKRETGLPDGSIQCGF
jgi:hypothetical protein